MTKLLERAVEAVRTLPAERQDDIARTLLLLAAEGDGPIALTPEEEAAIAESEAEAARGEFATDEQIRAIWAKHGL